MNRYFGFSKAQLRVLTGLVVVVILTGGYRFIQDYVIRPSRDQAGWRVEILEDYRPVLSMDPNLAPADSLELIPGIGPVLAQKIVAFREKAGPFLHIDSLVRVKGIGQEKLEQIKPYLKMVQP